MYFNKMNAPGVIAEFYIKVDTHIVDEAIPIRSRAEPGSVGGGGSKINSIV